MFLFVCNTKIYINYSFNRKKSFIFVKLINFIFLIFNKENKLKK